jgi:hypothetical protein
VVSDIRREPEHLDDDALMARLTEIARRVDPVPQAVRSFATSVIALRGVDDELARLVADSADRGRLVGARAATASRALVYELDGSQLELVIAGEHLIGWFADRPGTNVEVVTTSGTQTTRTDEYGEFRIARLPPGPFRVRVPGPASTTTEWVLRPR